MLGTIRALDHSVRCSLVRQRDSQCDFSVVALVGMMFGISFCTKINSYNSTAACEVPSVAWCGEVLAVINQVCL